MNSEIMFKINNKTLYLECPIVSLDIPLLFVCIDNDKNRYLCLCTDSEKLRYLVCLTENNNINDLLNSLITMRESIQYTSHIWFVETQDNLDNDIVKNIKYENIPNEDLPTEGAYLNFTNDLLKDYQKQLQIDELISLKEEILMHNKIIKTMSTQIENTINDSNPLYSSHDIFFYQKLKCA